MNYIVLLSLLCGTVIYAADQTQHTNYTVHIRELVKADYDPDNNLNKAIVGRAKYPTIVADALVVPSQILGIFLPRDLSRGGPELVTATNIIKQHANVDGEIICVDGKKKEIVFYMRSHRKNPDTRNAE
jgi:hypothetical protein